MQILIQPVKIWLLGIFGIFGFYVLYVLSLSQKASMESYLIVTSWPLLIVLLSIPFFKEKLTTKNIIGIFCALVGIYLIIGKGRVPQFTIDSYVSYLYATLAAFIWALYSIFCKKIKELKKQAIANFCFSATILSGLCHFTQEQHVAINLVTNLDITLIIIFLGVFPLGIAFFMWDFAMRYGDIKFVGTISYLGPIMGSILFIMLGVEQFSYIMVISLLLIVGGAFISSHKGKAQRLSQPNTNIFPTKNKIR